MNCGLQDDFSKALTPVLRALMFLTDNLRSLVLGFSTMEPFLKMLLGTKAETVSISQDARDGPASLADVRVSRTAAGRRH